MQTLTSGALALTLTAALAAQNITTTSLLIGAADTYGCQNSDNPPTLTGGVPASATFRYTYEQATRRLELVVTNTSAVTTGVPNPLLTRIYFNLPDSAVTGARLISQVGSGGATPQFGLSLGNEHGGCFGDFDARLEFGGELVLHGIANADADTVGGGSGAAVIGPVTFTIELSGPGVATMDARALAHGFSTGAALASVNAAAKFQAGGPNDDSGFLGTGRECATSMWVVGAPRIGTTVDFWRGGRLGCHDCLWISLFPGPTNVAGFRIPIGLPLLFSVDTGPFPFAPNVLPLPIPNEPRLVGRSAYFVLATFPPEGIEGTTSFSFGEAFVLTFQQL